VTDRVRERSPRQHCGRRQRDCFGPRAATSSTVARSQSWQSTSGCRRGDDGSVHAIPAAPRVPCETAPSGRLEKAGLAGRLSAHTIVMSNAIAPPHPVEVWKRSSGQRQPQIGRKLKCAPRWAGARIVTASRQRRSRSVALLWRRSALPVTRVPANAGGDQVAAAGSGDHVRAVRANRANRERTRQVVHLERAVRDDFRAAADA
jgi:hypothetical protein